MNLKDKILLLRINIKHLRILNLPNNDAENFLLTFVKYSFSLSDNFTPLLFFDSSMLS